MLRFSLLRLKGMAAKEFIQIIRDKYLLGMIIAIPIMQIVLFGYAIGLNPRHLPTAIVSADQSQITRAFVQAVHNTDYFDIVQVLNETEARAALERGEVKFVISFPVNFTRDLIRGQQPQVLLEADASDPTAVENAISAIKEVVSDVLKEELTGSLAYLLPAEPPLELVIYRKYNPASITQYNIVPGLIGVVLTMIMVMITSMAITRESEHGTMEMLLSTPVQPLEVMLGKVTPYIIIGYLQVGMILLVAKLLFAIPMEGSIPLLLLAIFPFILANLAVGITISTIASSQLQALQMSIFFFLPSILLSGFTFPFEGMPDWAQMLGNVLPLTHFLRIIRGVLLKGNGIAEIWMHIWPILIFIAVTLMVALNRYRRTLD